MFDIGWSEMLFMIVLAIVIVGPKELPALMKTVGRWVTKAKQMSREFQHNLEIVAEEAQLKDIQDELKADLKSIQDLGNEISNTKVVTGKPTDTSSVQKPADGDKA